MSIRNTAVAGTFYPNSCSEINRYIEHFNNILENSNFTIDTTIDPRAVIVPHAGYIYSGFTANTAYKYVENKKDIKTLIVIGPSHKVLVEGISVARYDEYTTPCGEIKIDTELSKELKENFDFISFNPDAHKEHSTETQFPFIEHYLKDIEVVELVYGKIDPQDISYVIDHLLEDPSNFIVISTDLSHFYPLDDANKIDNVCLNAISTMDTTLLDRGCEACGILGVKGLILSANKKNMVSKVIDYRTSADASGDASRVVGYVSAIIGDKI